MAVLAGGAALRESVTSDEVAHIGAGLSYWQKLDLRMNPEHPPLTKLLGALPLVLQGTRADYSSSQWTSSEVPFHAILGEWVFGDWVLFRWNDPTKTLMWARLPMLLLTLLLGWVIYRMARRLGGEWGGLLSLALYVSMPTFLAFGPLVLTDIAIALFWVLTVWTLADIYREPTRKRKWLFAMSLAAALLTKFTAGLLLFVIVIFALSTRWFPIGDQPSDKAGLVAWRAVRRRAVWGGFWRAALIVYGVYAVFTWNQPTWVLDHIPGGAAMVPVRRLLMPVWEYLMGTVWVLVTGRRPTFLLGQWYSHGLWYYFPVVLVLKTSLGFILVLLMGAVTGLIARWKLGKRIGQIPPAVALHWRALWISLLVMTAICFVSLMTISIRHFTVALVLLMLLVAPLPALLERVWGTRHRSVRLFQGAVAVSALACIAAALLAYPYYFPFMSVLAGGRPAYTLVSDSNVDWNQSLPEIREYAARRGLKEIRVDAFGMSYPTREIPGSQMWNCQTPQANDGGQIVVVSANFILDSHNCPWLTRLPSEEIAGGSMYAFQLPATIPPAGAPGGPPVPSQFRQIGGIPIERDTRALMIGLSENPDGIPAAVAEFRRDLERLQAEHKRRNR